MTKIPDYVLLRNCSYTNIDTFLSLRLLSRRVWALTRQYNHQLSRAVALGTFPD